MKITINTSFTTEFNADEAEEEFYDCMGSPEYASAYLEDLASKRIDWDILAEVEQEFINAAYTALATRIGGVQTQMELYYENGERFWG